MQLSSRGRRIVLIVLASLGFAYVVYVLGVFVALRSGVLQALTRESRDVGLEASGGYSFWPTRIVLQGARFRFKDYNIEMELFAPEATIVWSPLSLFEKTIRIDEFRAKGARYEMLHRVKHRHPNRQRLAAFPDTGFTRSKVYDSPRPPYEIPPFRIRVERIVATVSEAWLLEYRAIGHFEVIGGFELHEQVTVLPSRVTFHDVRVFLGEKELAERLKCDLRAQIGPFPGRDELKVALGASSGRFVCDGSLSDLSALRMYFPDSPLLLDARADLDLDLDLFQGQLRASSVIADVQVAQLGLERAAVSGWLELGAEVDPTGAALVSGEFTGDGAAGDALELGFAQLLLGLRQPKLTATTLQSASVRFDDLHVRDPSFLRRATGGSKAPLARLEQANLDVQYVARTQDAAGEFALQSSGALVIFPRVGSSVSCVHRSNLRCMLEAKSAKCADSEIECNPLTVSPKPQRSGDIDVRLHADALELEETRASSAWSIELGSPKEVLRALLPDTAWTNLGLAALPVGSIEGRFRVNRREETIAGTVERLDMGPFSAQAGFVLANSLVSRWRVQTPLGLFGVKQTKDGTEILPFVGKDWDVLALDE